MHGSFPFPFLREEGVDFDPSLPSPKGRVGPLPSSRSWRAGHLAVPSIERRARRSIE